MRFDYKNCRKLMHRELLGALTANAKLLRKLAKSERCTYRDLSSINGISFDLLPWEDFACVSLRTEEAGSAIRYSPADWKYYNLLDGNFFPRTRKHTGDIYGAAERKGKGHDAKHMIFLAAADALLTPDIARLLRKCGIEAPVVRRTIPYTGFDYLMQDEDQVIKANYCEIHIANRVAKRILGQVIA